MIAPGYSYRTCQCEDFPCCGCNDVDPNWEPDPYEEYDDEAYDRHDDEEDRSFRAFCEHDGCLWSSSGGDDSDAEYAELLRHNETTHPGLGAAGSVDEL